MTLTIPISIEARRGCGFRQPGGLYLVGPPPNSPCCRLPLPLHLCPTCGAGIHFSRGWTWVDTNALFFPNGEEPDKVCLITECPLNTPGYQETNIIGRAGLLWVGEQYYKTPMDLLREGAEMGISKRIGAVPHGFTLGETWVLLAHKKAVKEPDGTLGPGIFSVFQPTALEYVVRGDESQEELGRKLERGISPIRVQPKVARTPAHV